MKDPKFTLTKSKNHYFLLMNGKRVACVGNNSSSKHKKGNLDRHTLTALGKLLEEQDK